jgi:predicted dehydrogenase
MNKLKVAIAGYGVVGKQRRDCIKRHNLLRLEAVCDKQFHGNGTNQDGVNYFSDYKQLLKNELDILFVCLSNDMAAEVAIEGLKAGLHVFCEKPPGRNVGELLNVIAQEKINKKLKLMYGFNHRYHQSVKEALQILNSGKLGRVINLRGVYGKSKLITFNQPDWRTKRELAGGGVLLDQGIHMVDLMCLFGGNFSTVYSFISNQHWGYDVEDNAYAIMKSDQGVVGMLNSSATQWRHRFNLDINLERGSLILGGILSGSKSYGAETLTIVEADPDNDRGDPKETIIKYNQDLSWDEEVSAFIKSIMSDGPIENGSSNDALHTMQLVSDIYSADPLWRKKYQL